MGLPSKQIGEKPLIFISGILTLVDSIMGENQNKFYKRKQKPLAVERKNARNEDDSMEYCEKYKGI